MFSYPAAQLTENSGKYTHYTHPRCAAYGLTCYCSSFWSRWSPSNHLQEGELWCYQTCFGYWRLHWLLYDLGWYRRFHQVARIGGTNTFAPFILCLTLRRYTCMKLPKLKATTSVLIRILPRWAWINLSLSWTSALHALKTNQEIMRLSCILYLYCALSAFFDYIPVTNTLTSVAEVSHCPWIAPSQTWPASTSTRSCLLWK